MFQVVSGCFRLFQVVVVVVVVVVELLLVAMAEAIYIAQSSDQQSITAHTYTVCVGKAVAEDHL